MKILYDHQAFSEQTYGGISRYYAELIAGINQMPNSQAHLSLLFSNNIHLRESGLKVSPFFPNHVFPKKLEIMYRLNKLYSELALYRSSFDIFHATNYNPYFVSRLKGRPFVITFYDMIHEKFAGQYEELGDVTQITKYKKILAERADCIIAISESTKKDIVDLLNINPNKIQVVYLGSSLNTQSNLVWPKPTKPYLLYVGKRDAYKNFPKFLSAVSLLLKQYKLTLICAGGGAFTLEEQALVRALGLEQYIEQKRIDDDRALQALYGSAQAFVFPSLYEGFGIPVLEAFSCGCPCVLSNTSSLPEVADEAAIYFDPTSENSITKAVERIITDNVLRNLLIKNGQKRLEKFSWGRSVTETLAVYKTCI